MTSRRTPQRRARSEDAPLRDVDTQRRILGTLLVWPAYIPLLTEMGLTSACFDTRADQCVWAALSNLHAESVSPDPPAVIAWLKEHGHLDDVGAAYVFRLTDGCVRLPTDTLEHYVRKLLALMDARHVEAQVTAAVTEIRNDPERVYDHVTRLQSVLEVGTSTEPLRLIGDVDILRSPAPAYLIDRIVPADGNIMGYGGPGSGKTFVFSIGMGCAIATGRPWLGKTVVLPGPVVNVAGEGIRGIGKRIAAWKDHHGIARTEAIGFYTWTHGVDLRNPTSLRALIAACRPLKPRAIFFDTLARCAPGYDEISGQHCGQIIATLDELRRTLGGCAIIVVHHTAKNSEAERGHSGFRGAFDCMMSVTTADDLSEITCTKQKDDEEFPPIRFALRSARDAESCVAVPAFGALASAGLTSNAERALRILEERFALAIGATCSAWESECGLNHSTFHRAIKRLIDGGHVRLKSQHYQVQRTSIAQDMDRAVSDHDV